MTLAMLVNGNTNINTHITLTTESNIPQMVVDSLEDICGIVSVVFVKKVLCVTGDSLFVQLRQMTERLSVRFLSSSCAYISNTCTC